MDPRCAETGKLGTIARVSKKFDHASGDHRPDIGHLPRRLVCLFYARAFYAAVRAFGRLS